MNPLYGQQEQPLEMLSKLRQFMKSTDPAIARKQLREMLDSGQVSQERFNDAKKQAEQIAAFLGVK